MSFPGFEAGPVVKTEVVTPATLTTSTDYAPSGIYTASLLRLTTAGGAAATINSLAGGTDGRELVLTNIGTTDAITLLHDDGATGTAAMRILCPGAVSYVLGTRGTVVLRYDGTSSRWRVQ